MGAHRFFVNKISEGRAEILGEDYNHIVNVLRLKKGGEINVFNYEAGEFLAKIETIDPKNRLVSVSIVTQLKAREKKNTKICAIISIIKKENMEFILEKLTELGVDVIIPLVSKRTVVKIKEEEKKQKRWETIIYTAVKQCGRLSKPELMQTIEGVENINLNEKTKKFFVWEKEDNNFLIDEAVKIQPGISEVYFLTGPEGGFEDSEADIIKKKGFVPVSIGDTILRAETAAIVSAGVLVQALRRSTWKT